MSTTKKLLLVLGLAAIGGGAYYLIKAGKLVATPNLNMALPTGTTSAVAARLTPAQQLALLQKTLKTQTAMRSAFLASQAQ